MRWTAMALVLAGCGGGDPAAIVDASCPVAEGADAGVPDARVPDASPPLDAAQRQVTIHWTYTEDGVPATVPGDARSVLIVHPGVAVVYAAAREEAHQVTFPFGPGAGTVQIDVIDTNALVQSITFAQVPEDSDEIEVVLPYIREPRAQLSDLGTRVQSYVASHGSLPPAAVEEPIGNYCRGTLADVDNTWPEDPAPWAAEPWATLGFAIHGMHRFHYALRPNPAGTEIDLRARTDWDCDGTYQTWTLHGRLDASGALVYDPLNIDRPTE